MIIDIGQNNYPVTRSGLWQHQFDSASNGDIGELGYEYDGVGGFFKNLKKKVKRVGRSAKKALKPKSVLKRFKKVAMAPLQLHRTVLKRFGGRGGREMVDKFDQFADDAWDAAPTLAAGILPGGGLLSGALNMVKPRNPAPSEPGMDNPLPTMATEPAGSSPMPLILGGAAVLGLVLLLRRR